MSTNATEEREQVAARLRGAGLKVTESRLAVFDAFRPGEHLDADDVFTRVAGPLPTTSRQAVYGVLGALAEAGLLRKIEPAGSPALYETRVGDNHHHLVCTGCGKVFDVGCVVGEAACLTPSETHGFSIATAEVTFWGLCPECSASGALS
ncbi:Fur family ferric uptake transcriptional regulator [Agromyces cerinus]|uniref:Fur family transcriptional regulator n=1 Tax=Agromyces cerinus TaxID=33878 RepID=UPI0019596286|nr:Fur family transcriptional regulator [Agromyces cerinus]MBM7832822.1 Fur family ferric uptake transcriptional regulator [Agromyces cerinus]